MSPNLRTAVLRLNKIETLVTYTDPQNLPKPYLGQEWCKNKITKEVIEVQFFHKFITVATIF